MVSNRKATFFGVFRFQRSLRGGAVGIVAYDTALSGRCKSPVGYAPEQKQIITDASRDIGIVFVPNMSVGV